MRRTITSVEGGSLALGEGSHVGETGLHHEVNEGFIPLDLSSIQEFLAHVNSEAVKFLVPNYFKYNRNSYICVE